MNNLNLQINDLKSNSALHESKTETLNCLPSFLVKNLESSDEEQEQSDEDETFDNEDFNLAGYHSNTTSKHSHKCLYYPQDYKYPSFDNVSQNQADYYPINQYNMMPIQPHLSYPLNCGMGYGGHMFPPLQNNCMFNSFNYVPHQTLATKTHEKDVPKKSKKKKASMINMNMTSSIMNSFKKEQIVTEPMRIQSQAQALINNQAQKIQPKKKKKSKKINSDKSSINPSSLASFLSLSDKDLYSYTITQKGSRDVQSFLKKAKDKDVEKLLFKIAGNFADIMMDKYGNYFSQKIIQICSLSQRITLLEIIRPRFTEISCNSFGTHPLQSLIELINVPKEREILAQSIENNEIELSLDTNGTHVIQKFISCTTNEEREAINNNILNHIGDLINDSFGVCVLIKLIKHSTTMSLKERVSTYISMNDPLCLIQSPFSNYVVQSLLNKTDIVLCKDIVRVITENFFTLSMEKYSSNVVENCIRYSEEAIAITIYNDAITSGKVSAMLKNTYGGFVIEKIVARLNKDQKAEIIKEVQKLGKEITISNTLLILLSK